MPNLMSKPSSRSLLVTGGAGFIGSNFIHHWLSKYPSDQIINLDALTYAGNLNSLTDLADRPNYRFVHGNICDQVLVDELMSQVEYIVHFAAESHVDRSITDPDVFLQTNVLGTHTLLKSALKHRIKRFHHVSTDEVFGSLPLDSQAKFNLKTQYDPRSPYSASKAASDHLVRAYGVTYQLPFTITNCANNYGPYQFPEKLFGLAITNILEGKKVPVYDDGAQIRDWLFVTDHCLAIEKALLQGIDGQTYLVGGLTEDISNLSVIKLILQLMGKTESDIVFVKDRPGHDQRYSIDWSVTRDQLDWRPQVTLEEGLRQTISWYQAHPDWWQPLKAQSAKYYQNHYGNI